MSAPDRTSSQAGFTIVEILVGTLILLIGVGGLLKVTISSGHSNVTAENNQSGTALAQRELEKVRALDYSQVKMSSATYGSSSGQGDPRSRLSGSTFTPANGSAESLVGAAAGDCTTASPCVDPHTAYTIGSGSRAQTVDVYRFVTWASQGCETGAASNATSSLATGLSALQSDTASYAAATTTAAQSLLTTINGLVGSSSDSKTVRSLYGLIAAATAAGSNMDTILNSMSALVNALLGTAQTTANTIKAYAIGGTISGLTEVGLMGPAQALLTALDGTGGLASKLTSLKNAADALNASVAALTSISGSTSTLASDVSRAVATNLCSLSLSRLGKVGTVKTAMATARTAMATAASAAPTAASAGTTANNALSTMLTNAKNDIAGVEDQLIAASNAPPYSCVLTLGTCLPTGITAGLNAVLNTLNPIKTALADTAANTTTGEQRLEDLLTAPVSTVSAQTTAVGNAVTTVTNGGSAVDAAKATLNNAATSLKTALDDAASNPNLAKRVTIAIVFNSGVQGAGPDQPVWMATLVEDPTAGLIG